MLYIYKDESHYPWSSGLRTGIELHICVVEILMVVVKKEKLNVLL